MKDNRGRAWDSGGCSVPEVVLCHSLRKESGTKGKQVFHRRRLLVFSAPNPSAF